MGSHRSTTRVIHSRPVECVEINRVCTVHRTAAYIYCKYLLLHFTRKWWVAWYVHTHSYMRAVLEQRSSTVSLALGTVRPERSGLRAQSSELEIESRLVVAATASRKGKEKQIREGPSPAGDDLELLCVC